MRILHKQFEYNLKVIHIIIKFSELFEKYRCLFPSSVHSEKKKYWKKIWWVSCYYCWNIQNWMGFRYEVVVVIKINKRKL